MFLSVVILGGFTTETHAMALHIQRPTRRRHLHRFTGRNPGAATALTRRTASNRSGQIHGRLRALSCPPVGSSYWPLLGTFMSASGQFFMSADSRSSRSERGGERRPAIGDRAPVPCTWIGCRRVMLALENRTEECRRRLDQAGRLSSLR